MFWVDNSSQRISKAHWKTHMCGFMYAYDKGTHTSVRTGEGLIMKEDVYRETRQLSWRVKGVQTYTTTTLRGSEKEWKGCSTLQEYVSREGVSVCVCVVGVVCAYVCVCLCLNAFVFIFFMCVCDFALCLFVSIFTYAWVSVYVCVCCMCACVFICMYVFACAYECAWICVCLRVCVHVSVYVCT